MSEKKEMDIEYNNIKTKLSLPDKFSEFKELCIQTFYISELRSQKMNFCYVDEDNDDVKLDEDSYEGSDARKAKFWKLSIGDKKKNSSNSKKDDQSKKEFIAQKEKLIGEAKLYKEKLFGECSRIIEEKIKQKNEEHKNNIQKIKDQFEKNLKEFKNLVDKQTKEYLGKISENAMNVYIEKSQFIDKSVIDAMSMKLGEFEDSKKDLGINMEEIGKNLTDTTQNVKDCKEIFQDIVKESKFLKFIINEAKITNNIIDLKNGVKFKIKIKRLGDIKTNNSFLRIQNSEDKKYEDIKIDLKEELKEEKEIEITFNPHITEIKEYLFNMVLINDKNIISNIARLIINVHEPGSFNYFFNDNEN
jgi:hypothetical protein